ncbi:MAG: hypothetical protein AAFP84_07960 [Actinomycetota bacterium]
MTFTTSAPPTTPSSPVPVARRSRRSRTIGAAIAVVGLLAAVLLWFLADARHDDAVRSLARAPVGCDTTLDFAEPGEYLVFVETRGEIPTVRGDCELEGGFDLAGGQAGDGAGQRVPSVELTVVDPDGETVPVVSRRDRESYDRAGSVGVSAARITISEAGDHVIRVESSSTSAFAVAIGADPAEGVGALRLAALAAAVLGLLVGAAIAVVRVRGDAPPPPPPGNWPPVAGGPQPGGWGAPVATGPPPMQTPSGPPAASNPGAASWPPVTPPGQPASPPPSQPSPPPPSSWPSAPAAPTAGAPPSPPAGWSNDAGAMGAPPAAPGAHGPVDSASPAEGAPPWLTDQEPSPWDSEAREPRDRDDPVPPPT